MGLLREMVLEALEQMVLNFLAMLVWMCGPIRLDKGPTCRINDSFPLLGSHLHSVKGWPPKPAAILSIPKGSVQC